eukprot:TRINITY_DN61799_c0_g1_i1.p1 TRINITY_DN61799_c0_g1~~TRINITY_DN61799_c0_g1_i1.p1  ORF type:complete len:733 (-),score=170.59 TRINITY_DN61799_c0_g1_i1:103-2250(-)
MAVDQPAKGAAEPCPSMVLGEELRKMLEHADARWRDLETQLDQAMRETLEKYAKDLEERFGIANMDISDNSEGSFCWKVRGRVHRVLLGPTARRLRKQVLLPEEQEKELAADEAVPLVLDDLLDRWELEVEPLLGKASEQDARLARRARRKAKQGCSREAWQVESKERPEVWEPALGALEGIACHVRRLSGCLEEEASPEAISRLASCVPAVIARAVVDWHFAGPLAELEQLENWWEGVSTALQARAELWERLVKDEGVFLRRITRGVDALRSARQLYQTYADFGASPGSSGDWPSHLMHLLAEAAKEMTSRLRPVRDSAAWRVVDAAKSIQKELQEAAKQATRQGPWQGVSQQEGVKALIQALGNQAENSPSGPPGSSPEEAAVVLMSRVGQLASTLGDLRQVFGVEALSVVLGEVVQDVAALSEDLLGVLDEPSEEGLADCVKQLRCLGEASQAAGRLEAALEAEALAKSAQQLPAQEKRQKVALLRGLHAFLASPELCEGLAWGSPDGSVASSAQEPPVSDGVAPLDHAPVLSASAAEEQKAQRSPRGGYAGGYASRRQRFEGEASPDAAAEPSPLVESEIVQQVSFVAPTSPTVPTLALSREALEATRSSPSSAADAARTLSCSRPGTGGSGLRPGTPSWLRPPWQRPDTPSAVSWTRPDTPSTVCDDTEAAALPRWKCVDGEYVPLKAVAVHARLAPLQAPSSGRRGGYG